MSNAEPPPLRRLLWLALALSLGAAVSLGITRFAYGLLLPVMKDDLGWRYTLAGAMNTANAAGYLLGALTTPRLMRRFGVARVLLAGALLASAFMAASGFFTAAGPLLLQRLLAGVASAWVFVAGGLMAARLGALAPAHAGLLLGLYYGGTGWGIVLSALGVPALLSAAQGVPHGWAWAWWGLALGCVVATAGLAWPARALQNQEHAAQSQSAPAPEHRPDHLPWRGMALALAGYGLFGVGYIGYMTFVIALLREQGVGGGAITAFYALLGLAVVASARIWAGLLQRARGGGALALLNALLGVATVLPALTGAWPVVLASGLLFGAVFLSVVASTTAFVRHNLPALQWAAGISAFTIVFAAGQIVGPTVVGWIADGPGGLARGLVYSAAALWLGALLAWRQRPLAGGPR
ncbi:YbfB/YjiJ family MFS transporter [Ottowia sp.]|uniref:YbfB/YjiJ family MFS transporter n=1 Tax=Ottowia sp. TaxID=1898956 RepID=UPI002BA92711|nr:YbfB/YjiJ family MFS transporter [Ottowia sp.]HOB67872.1 YbfB/YjiJ family MFS transporter [Ottowia sp.]HPZ55725.1 YbfB/YjiJ family MFS transporter [Ottowia sp.]HQD46342.1 YbfB/YjiJ family MFS transporter [Ottowia sp.]